MKNILRALQRCDEEERELLQYRNTFMFVDPNEASIDFFWVKMATLLSKNIRGKNLIPTVRQRGQRWRVGLVTILGVSFEYSITEIRGRILIQLGYYYK